MRRFGPKRCLLGILTLAFAWGIAPGEASAEVISYYLQTFNLNANPNLPTSNYAKITLEADNVAGTVDFGITTVFPGSFDSAAKLNIVGFNFDSPELDGIAASNFTSLPASYNASTGGQLDGYGDFEWVVQADTSAANLRTTAFSFTITGLNSFLTAGAWTLADVFDPNAGGRLFAAHYYPSFDNYPNLVENTGWIDGATVVLTPPPPPPVPEPSSLALVGFGLCSVLGYRRFRRGNS